MATRNSLIFLTFFSSINSFAQIDRLLYVAEDYGYPSCGDVIDAQTKKIVAQVVESEKVVEVQFENGKAIHAGTR